MCRLGRETHFTPKGVSIGASDGYKHSTTTWLWAEAFCFGIRSVVPLSLGSDFLNS